MESQVRRATGAVAVDGHLLDVSRSDGSTVTVDVKPYMALGVFRALRDPSLFCQVQVDPLGGAEWPNGASLPPELLSADQSEIDRRLQSIAAGV
jgi:hypothetical protein